MLDCLRSMVEQHPWDVKFLVRHGMFSYLISKEDRDSVVERIPKAALVIVNSD